MRKRRYKLKSPLKIYNSKRHNVVRLKESLFDSPCMQGSACRICTWPCSARRICTFQYSTWQICAVQCIANLCTAVHGESMQCISVLGEPVSAVHCGVVYRCSAVHCGAMLGEWMQCSSTRSISAMQSLQIFTIQFNTFQYGTPRICTFRCDARQTVYCIISWCLI